MSIDRIRFERLDRHKPDEVRKTSGIVNYVIHNMESLKDLAACMNIVTRYDNWLTRFNEWKQIPNGDTQLKELLETLFSSLKNENIFISVRGVLLERILEELVKVKYSHPAKREVGCKVIIDNIAIPDDSSITISTLDFAGWNGSFGEFYEAKAHPKRFTSESIDLLTNLHKNLTERDIEHLIGCVSYNTRDAMIQVFKREKFNTDIFMFFGQHELRNLSLDMAS